LNYATEISQVKKREVLTVFTPTADPTTQSYFLADIFDAHISAQVSS